jgi:hypothetical protein
MRRLFIIIGLVLVISLSSGCSAATVKDLFLKIRHAPVVLYHRLAGHQAKPAAQTETSQAVEVKIFYGPPPLEINYVQIGQVRGASAPAGSPWPVRLKAILAEAKALGAEAVILPEDPEADADAVTGRAIRILKTGDLNPTKKTGGD